MKNRNQILMKRGVNKMFLIQLQKEYDKIKFKCEDNFIERKQEIIKQILICETNIAFATWVLNDEENDK